MKRNEAQEQFFQHIAANVDYWLQQTEDLSRRDLNELDVDRQNIFQAIQHGLAHSHTRPLTLQLILQCWLLIERRGYWREWIPVLQQAIELCRDSDLAMKGQLLNRLGQSCRQERQWGAAVTHHQEAKRIAAESGNALLAAQANYYLCSAYLNNRQYAEAEQYGLEALAAFSRIAPESFWVGATYNELGMIALWRGEMEVAESRLREAVGRWRQAGDIGEVGNSLINLALALQSAGRPDEALAHYQEAITLLASAGSELRKVLAQTNMGALYYEQGDYPQAEKTFRQVDMAYLRQIGNLSYQAVVAQSLGTVALAQSRLETAESYLRQSYALWLQMDDEINLANTLGSLAEVTAAQGKIGEALPLYEEACRKLSAFPDHMWAHKLLREFTEALEILANDNID
jgi:tetratricopeptide (TPR) repeat protein